ncbi:hypothetical protein L1987_64636 [Smallanthus sonchifolius]|uniref:Uncharacterized protein n=1 Tax=Smallanthus sonchifolius TaxID=185202 RepID=A0ACB9BSH2_9ASTR|nr:hypothetical protein L1987_64636 [Smallanthus sonchifolius]
MKLKTSTSNSNRYSSATSDSYFTTTSNSSTTGGSSKIKKIEQIAMEEMNTATGENAAVTTVTATTNNATGNGKRGRRRTHKLLPSCATVVTLAMDLF